MILTFHRDMRVSYKKTIVQSINQSITGFAYRAVNLKSVTTMMQRRSCVYSNVFLSQRKDIRVNKIICYYRNIRFCNNVYVSFSSAVMHYTAFVVGCFCIFIFRTSDRSWRVSYGLIGLPYTPGDHYVLRLFLLFTPHVTLMSDTDDERSWFYHLNQPLFSCVAP